MKPAPTTWIPTSSSTAQMVLGDVLAICLLKLRGFNSRKILHGFIRAAHLEKGCTWKYQTLWTHQLRLLFIRKSGVKDTLDDHLLKTDWGATAVWMKKTHWWHHNRRWRCEGCWKRTAIPTIFQQPDMMTRSPKNHSLRQDCHPMLTTLMQSHKITQADSP